MPKRRRAHAGFSPTTDPVQTHAPGRERLCAIAERTGSAAGAAQRARAGGRERASLLVRRGRRGAAHGRHARERARGGVPYGGASRGRACAGASAGRAAAQRWCGARAADDRPVRAAERGQPAGRQKRRAGPVRAAGAHAAGPERSQGARPAGFGPRPRAAPACPALAGSSRAPAAGHTGKAAPKAGERIAAGDLFARHRPAALCRRRPASHGGGTAGAERPAGGRAGEGDGRHGCLRLPAGNRRRGKRARKAGGCPCASGALSASSCALSCATGGDGPCRQACLRDRGGRCGGTGFSVCAHPQGAAGGPSPSAPMAAWV